MARTWEYKRSHVWNGPDALVKRCDELDGEGWEVISHSFDDRTGAFDILCRRPFETVFKENW
jgi:hypothetical protein